MKKKEREKEISGITNILSTFIIHLFLTTHHSNEGEEIISIIKL